MSTVSDGEVHTGTGLFESGAVHDEVRNCFASLFAAGAGGRVNLGDSVEVEIKGCVFGPELHEDAGVSAGEGGDEL